MNINETILEENPTLRGLNPEQKAAVETINGPLLIIAGAGSGKTKVITNRVANLIRHGIAPWNILALTFTNKAAGELKKRIANIVEPEVAEKVWAGTFHSIFAKLLRYDCDKIGYDSSFSIYDADDSLSLIKKVLTSMNISDSNYSPQAIRSKISSFKSQNRTWQSIYDKPRNQFEKTLAEVYKNYTERLRENNAMDFDDLLLNFIRLLENSPETLRKYQERFKYILVDEYQDTNHTQYVAVKMLANNYKNICVVGDDAQSIYGWRGADIQNILDFKSDYPNAKIFKLEQNYRSTKNILAAADSVIKNNSNQLKKTLRTENPTGELIENVSCETDIEEADFVVSRIKEHLRLGRRTLKDFAVLYRTNAQSLEFEKACRRHKLPYIIIGGMSFYKRKEIKDTLCYLKLLVNSRDGESFLRVVNEPARGIGATSLTHIINYARISSLSLLTAFSQADSIIALQNRAVLAAKKYADFVNAYKQRLLDEDYADVASEYIFATGMIDFYREMGTDEALDKIRNIEQVVNDVILFREENPESSLEDYLQQIALISDIDDKEFGSERLPLMTLHSAKGLEFKEVFIAGLERGLFPLSRSEQDPKEEEEERRLFYVGITRAEEKLYVTYATRRMKFGQINYQVPSPFLREIDADLFNHINASGEPAFAKTTFKEPTAKPQSYFSDIPKEEFYSQIEPQSGFEFNIGDLVRHKQFGVGKVTGLAGAGMNRKATVNFSNIGKKQLLLQYAKLELVKQSK